MSNYLSFRGRYKSLYPSQAAANNAKIFTKLDAMNCMVNSRFENYNFGNAYDFEIEKLEVWNGPFYPL